MKRKLLVLIVLGTFIIATTCGCLNNTENTKTLNMTFLGKYEKSSNIPIECWHDDDLNVTCYTYGSSGAYGKGISCISDKDIGK